MKTIDFDFELPSELIAQEPSKKRDFAKLLVVDRKTDNLKDLKFYNIIDYLGNNDVLVLNNTKVEYANIKLKKRSTNANFPLLVVQEYDDNSFLVMTKNQRRMKIGDILFLSEDESLEFEVLDVRENGFSLIKNNSSVSLTEIKEKYGSLPLPPYIKNHETFKNYYQTIFASKPGSIAAPTAGLHFTSELLEELTKKGVKIVYITLNIGLGTFLPVKADDILDHKMHKETYTITKETADELNRYLKEGKKITCCGTTSVRTIESNFDGEFHSGSFETGIFIYPGYKFKATDHIITNFHLPKSTLIMLVSAFYEKDKIFKAYEHAIAEKYHFYSFGDAMLLL